MYHNPVLLNNCIEGLNINPKGIYVDVTFGGGGHSKAILEHIDTGRLIAFDQDPDAANNLIDDDRFTFISQNFRYLKNFLRLYQIEKIDGLLADLGVSSHQIDVPERGFSTRLNGALDMRMDRHDDLTAETLVNTYEIEELTRMFREYGEIGNAYKLAGKIVTSRTDNPITTTAQLKEIAAKCAPRGKENKYYATVFQAIRIEVNDELSVLKDLLEQATELLAPGGRLVMISYHSLEDRLVKNFLRSGNFKGEIEKDFFGNPIVPYKTITRKPIVPEESEIEDNPRARSAKLRIAEKLRNDQE